MKYRLDPAKRGRFFVILIVVLLATIGIVFLVVTAVPKFIGIFDKLGYSGEDTPLKHGIYLGSGIDIEYNQVRNAGLSYFVAKIDLKNIECLNKKYVRGEPKFSNLDNPETIALREVSILLTNAESTQNIEDGLAIANGKLLSFKPTERETLVIFRDKSMRAYTGSQIQTEEDANRLISEGAWCSFSEGPTLVRDGLLYKEFNERDALAKTARTGIGLAKDGSYVIIVVDANTRNSDGIDLPGFAELFGDCEVAYCLGGGSFSSMFFNGELVNGIFGRTSPRMIADYISFSDIKE